MPGFLCRIDGSPGLDRDPCINTPPASAYWSYWHAARGGAWSSSQEGGKTRTPPVGSVDGWSFSDDGSPGEAPPPRIDPPAASTTPKPATTTPKPATPTPAATATPTPSPNASPTMPAPAGPAAIPAPSGTSATPANATASSADPTPFAGSEAQPGGSVGPDGTTVVSDGPPLGTLVGVALVVLIAAGALVAGARRPRGVHGDA